MPDSTRPASRLWCRTVLAVRAGGVLLIAIGIRQPLGALTRWGMDRDVWLAAEGGAPAVSGRIGTLSTAARTANPWPWALYHGPTLCAIAGGVYLLVRRSERLAVGRRRERD